jgi:hypothetical protein
MSWTFDPWNLGADVRYRGIRLLLLGESHYDDGDPPETDSKKMRSWTVDAVRDWAVGSQRQRFFANTYVAVTSDRWAPDSSDVSAFWNSVYFYNYVQDSVGIAARQRPTREMWQRSHASFEAVVQRLRPDAILVLGRATWRNMADGELAAPLDMGSPPIREPHCATYRYGSALAAHTPHPSSTGFSPRVWSPLVAALVDQAAKSRGRASGSVRGAG